MQDKFGEIFVDGRIINLDTSTMDVLDRTVNEINVKQKVTVDNINSILNSL